MKRKIRIALVLYTAGIDYDDRIRKEILSICKYFENVSFKIFAVEPKNKEEQGLTSYGVEYRIPFLTSREKYPSGTHTLKKALDFYKVIRGELKEFDIIWCADLETFPFVFFNYGKPLIWDLHELPTFFSGNFFFRRFFRYLCSKCDIIVHANEARLEVLKKMKMIGSTDKHYVLRNFPQFNEIDTEYDDLYSRFIEWKGSDDCVYLQGLSEPTRAPFETVDSVLQSNNLKAVLVGYFDKSTKDALVSKYGEAHYNQFIFETGRIKQIKTPQYIRQCKFSMIFYKNTCDNNYYCEANRLYQSVVNGLPVIVGSNPPMKDLVQKYNVGIVLNTDGSNIEEIKNAISDILANYQKYVNNTGVASANLLWSSQDDIIKSFTNRIISKIR